MKFERFILDIAALLRARCKVSMCPLLCASVTKTHRVKKNEEQIRRHNSQPCESQLANGQRRDVPILLVFILLYSNQLSIIRVEFRHASSTAVTHVSITVFLSCLDNCSHCRCFDCDGWCQPNDLKNANLPLYGFERHLIHNDNPLSVTPSICLQAP